MKVGSKEATSPPSRKAENLVAISSISNVNGLHGASHHVLDLENRDTVAIGQAMVDNGEYLTDGKILFAEASGTRSSTPISDQVPELT